HQSEAGEEAGRSASSRSDGGALSRCLRTVIFSIEVAIGKSVLAVVVPIVRITRDDADILVSNASSFQLLDSGARIAVIIVQARLGWAGCSECSEQVYLRRGSRAGSFAEPSQESRRQQSPP